jgi:membrane protein required for colicin V production
MILDLIFLAIVALSVFEGYKKGLVVAVFSFLAFIIGLAAAVKLSATVANYLRENAHMDTPWLPVISFVGVLVIVIVLVRWGAVFVSKLIELAFLGWANKIGGAIMYVLINTIIFSVVIFYAEKIGLLGESVKNNSQVYPIIKDWGPAAFDMISSIFPFMKNAFEELQLFFEQVNEKVQTASVSIIK